MLYPVKLSFVCKAPVATLSESHRKTEPKSYFSQLKEKSKLRPKVRRIQGIKVIQAFPLLVLDSELLNPVG